MSQQCFTLDANYLQQRNSLVSTISDCKDTILQLGEPGKFYANRASEMQHKLTDEPFRVLIIGKFKNGKSTFINALFGENLMPACNIPCTLTISAVRYSESKNGMVEICFNDNIPQHLPSISDKINNHLEKYRGRNIPVLQLSIKEVNKVVRINETKLRGVNRDKNRERQDKAKIDALYKRLTYFSDNELLKSGVEIIDSPGFGESKVHDTVTLDYIKHVDAFIFVLDATKAGDAQEVEVASKYMEGRENACFVVVNKIDAIAPDPFATEEEMEESRLEQLSVTLEKINSVVEPFTSHQLYPISSWNAISGRLSNNLLLFNSSGILQLERDLSDFLTGGEIGIARLTGECKELSGLISECLEEINKQEILLKQKYDELANKYKNQNETIKLVRKRINSLISKIRDNASSCYGRVIDVYDDYVLALGKYVTRQVDSFNPGVELSRFEVWNIAKENKEVTSKIGAYIAEETKSYSSNWQSNEFKEFIENEEERLFSKDVKREISDVLANIQAIENNVANKEDGCITSNISNSIRFSSSINVNVDQTKLSELSSGHQFQNIGLSLTGGVGTAAFIGVVTGAIVFAPVAIAGASISAALLAIGMILDSADRRILDLKKEVIKAFIAKLNDSKLSSAKKICDEFSKLIENRIKSVENSLNGKLDQVLERVEASLETLKHGNEQQRLEELKELRAQFYTMKAKLSEFVEELKVKKAKA